MEGVGSLPKVNTKKEELKWEMTTRKYEIFILRKVSKTKIFNIMLTKK